MSMPPVRLSDFDAHQPSALISFVRTYSPIGGLSATYSHALCIGYLSSCQVLLSRAVESDQEETTKVGIFQSRLRNVPLRGTYR